jgi:hypothetical protein
LLHDTTAFLDIATDVRLRLASALTEVNRIAFSPMHTHRSFFMLLIMLSSFSREGINLRDRRHTVMKRPMQPNEPDAAAQLAIF